MELARIYLDELALAYTWYNEMKENVNHFVFDIYSWKHATSIKWNQIN